MEKLLPNEKTMLGEGLEDSDMKGVSSLLRMKEGWREDGASGKDEGLGFVLRGIDINREANGNKEQEADVGMPDGVNVSGGGSALYAAGDIGVNGDVSAGNGGDGNVEARKLGLDRKNEEGESVCVEGQRYSVGDFVWGKIKTHPWWPGRVYDPVNASDYASKLRQDGKLLVAYFGDGTFAWCHPSQLKPFEEHFDEMVKQSSSRAFQNAVKEAMDELGGLVNMKMTCPCVGGTERSGPFVVNSGVKDGLVLPDEGIEKLEVSSIEPADLLKILRHKALASNVVNGIELGVLKGWILGYCRAKLGVGYELPVYVEPETIPGLEDQRDSRRFGNENAGANGDAGVLNWGPVEEEKEAEQQGAWENGTQRKQKSIAEILGAETHSKDKGSQRKRKLTKLLESAPMVQSGGSGVDAKENGDGKQEKTKRGRKKKGAILSGKSGGGEVKNSEPQEGKSSDETDVKRPSEKGHISRGRKKSKYLSPPYLNIKKGDKKSGMMAELLRDSNIVGVGEHMTESADNIVGSDEKIPPKSSGEAQTKQKRVNSQTPERVEAETETSNPMEVKASPREVLSKVHTLARDPRRRLSIDAVEGFLHNFRSSVYDHSSESALKSKGQSGRKRKPQDQIQSEVKTPEVRSRGRPKKKSVGSEIEASKLHSVPILYDGNQVPTDVPSAGTKPKRKRAKKGDEPALATPDVKKAKEPKPPKQKKVATNTVAKHLVVSFGPGSSLPTKEDLISVYKKFGPLNEYDTNMYYNNFSGVIAFLNASDAESALDSSLKVSPFVSARATFELKPPHPKMPKKGSSSQPKKQKKASTPNPTPSEVEVIREKLQTVTSILEKSNGKLSKKMRARLEGELKGVLEKVSGVGGSSASG